MSRGWLIVFAKAPRPGLVKTRMSPPLSLDECAELYEAMLVDILEASAGFAASLDLIPVLAFHPPDAVGELIGRAPPGFRLQVQKGVDLGERMANAFAEAGAAGAPRVLLRGSDSPALEGSVFDEAMSRLDAGDDLVLTPDQSGGYAMIGMRAPHPTLFEPAMSTEEVMEQTVSIAGSLGLRSSITTPGFDLDTVEDFRCFDALSPTRSLDLCPRTVELISTLSLDNVL
jgi:rSAM/selenodomain-associated transferase 1